jgi:hypothetical protein
LSLKLITNKVLVDLQQLELDFTLPKKKKCNLHIKQNNYSSQFLPSSFTFIDLFAGIGGFRIAFQNLGGKCVFSSEIDRYSRQTYGKCPIAYKRMSVVGFGLGISSAAGIREGCGIPSRAARQDCVRNRSLLKTNL